MENQIKTTLIIADDHDMLTELLKNHFKDKGYNVVGTAKNGKEVLNLLTKHQVDLVLMDYEMPEMDGIEATRLISKAYPSTKVLMLSMFTKPAYIEEALKAGAKGYMSKGSKSEEIELAFKEMQKGNTYLSPNIASIYIAFTKEQEQNKIVRITPFEKKILMLLNSGNTAKQVAVQLEVNDNFITNSLKILRIKFGVNNITGLLAAAREVGYIK